MAKLTVGGTGGEAETAMHTLAHSVRHGSCQGTVGIWGNAVLHGELFCRRESTVGIEDGRE